MMRGSSWPLRTRSGRAATSLLAVFVGAQFGGDRSDHSERARAGGPAAPAARAAPFVDDGSCKVCHPGAVEGLRRSPHAALLTAADVAARACTVCHGDLTAHAAAASRPGNAAPVAVPAVAAASCAECHPDAGYAPARAAHALPDPNAPGALVAPDGVEVPPSAPAAADRALVEALEARADGGIRWSGLLDFGYRLVHVAGSRAAYRTDVDLEPGARVRGFEVRALAAGDAGAGGWFDDAWVRAHDLGDPRWDVGGRVARDGAYEVDGGYRRDRYHYEAGGDYHRVDRRATEARTDFTVDLAADLQLFGAFSRRGQQGFWLTERIGEQALTPQTYISNVESPRDWSGDLGELGLKGRLGVWHWTASANYRDERGVDRWLYSQPATANPAFTESEDFTSRTSLRGPGGRVTLAADLDAVQVDLAGGLFEHDRRVTGNGVQEGFDTAQYFTDSRSVGAGSAELIFAELGVVVPLCAEWALLGDAHWRDYGERYGYSQFERTTIPSTSTIVDVTTDLDEDTSQRLLEAEAMLQWTPGDDFDLAAGYGVAHEWLRVPNLVPSDPRDFKSGYSRDAGPLAELSWRFHPDWTLRADAREFGMDGVALYEIEPSRGRQARGSLGWQRDGNRATAFVRHRRNENPVSLYDYEHLAAGLDVGVSGRGLTFSTTYTYSRTDSRSLTNFYFDPDPNPMPTFVGFTGDTHTVASSLLAQPSADVEWEFTAAWTTTSGSFDVAVLDWGADVRWRAFGDAGQFGLDYRAMRYTEHVATEDWSAQLLFVYWRATW